MKVIIMTKTDEIFAFEIRETDRNWETKMKFMAYLSAHPEERFWQSVRNFSDYDFILGSNHPNPVENPEWAKTEDTFNKEGK